MAKRIPITPWLPSDRIKQLEGELTTAQQDSRLWELRVTEAAEVVDKLETEVKLFKELHDTNERCIQNQHTENRRLKEILVKIWKDEPPKDFGPATTSTLSAYLHGRAEIQAMVGEALAGKDYPDGPE